MTSRLGLILKCEGMGDCLFAIPVIKKLYAEYKDKYVFDLFTHHPGLFKAHPSIENAYAIGDGSAISVYASANRTVHLFETNKLPHWGMDTFDFLSVPLGLGTLSFREKQLEYYPSEKDQAQAFDVVLNTSHTWATRSWPVAHWQRLADRLVSEGLSVAVVGKDVSSSADKMEKRSYSLEGCVNLVNKLSLDQTYYTIGKCGVFVSCQNGLSVLAGATDAEIMVLDMPIEWCKRAIYRKESPFYKIEYIKGNCPLYCAEAHCCPKPENQGQILCIPNYEQVEAAVLQKLASRLQTSTMA